MKKQLIMAALGLVMAAGVTSAASAAPISGSVVGASEASTNLAQTVHYRRHHHHNHGWRRWRPRMFGYMRHRHHHHRRQYHRYGDYGHGHGHHHHRRHYH